jgi:hypothetical protein
MILPQSVFMCFVWISEQKAIISLYNIKLLVFITEALCVYRAVRTESLSTTRILTIIFMYTLHLPRQTDKSWGPPKNKCSVENRKAVDSNVPSGTFAVVRTCDC